MSTNYNLLDNYYACSFSCLTWDNNQNNWEITLEHTGKDTKELKAFLVYSTCWTISHSGFFHLNCNRISSWPAAIARCPNNQKTRVSIRPIHSIQCTAGGRRKLLYTWADISTFFWSRRGFKPILLDVIMVQQDQNLSLIILTWLILLSPKF